MTVRRAWVPCGGYCWTNNKRKRTNEAVLAGVKEACFLYDYMSGTVGGISAGLRAFFIFTRYSFAMSITSSYIIGVYD